MKKELLTETVLLMREKVHEGIRGKNTLHPVLIVDDIQRWWWVQRETG